MTKIYHSDIGVAIHRMTAWGYLKDVQYARIYRMNRAVTAEKQQEAMVPLFTRLYSSDRTKLDELVDSYPAIPRKKIRKDTPTTRKITDAEVIRIAIADLHKKRVERKRKKI